MEVINRKENKAVGTICLEVRIPIKKKPKIILEFFYLSFRRKYLCFDSTFSFWKKTKALIEMLLLHQKAPEI